jgi:hypothetical protein
MTIDLFIPILRQLLHMVGGYMIAQGYFDEGATDAFVGLGINLATLIWWLIDRYRINEANKAVAKVAADKTDGAGA